MMTAPTSTARSARTTPMPVPATRTAGFIARRPDERPGFAIWATGHSVDNRHGLATTGKVTHANGTAERRCFGDHAEGKTQSSLVDASLPVRTRRTIPPIMSPNLRAIGVSPHVAQNQAVSQNRQDPQQRHRRTDHSASGVWHVAITPGDGRMHSFGWGKQHGTIAQDQTSGCGGNVASRSFEKSSSLVILA